MKWWKYKDFFHEIYFILIIHLTSSQILTTKQLMRKTILMIALFYTFNLEAQTFISGTINQEIHFLTSEFSYNNKDLIYTIECVNNTSTALISIYDESFNISKQFTIQNLYKKTAIQNCLLSAYKYSVTQTLFNSDEKFEIIQLVLNSNNIPTGANVISEDGSLLATIPTNILPIYQFIDSDGTVTLWEPILRKIGDSYFFYSRIWNSTLKRYESNYAKIIQGSTTLNIPAKIGYSRVYPNPVNSNMNFIIELNEILHGDINLLITDNSGKPLIKKHFNNCNTNKISVSLGKINPGIYFYLILKNQNTIEKGKFIID